MRRRTNQNLRYGVSSVSEFGILEEGRASFLNDELSATCYTFRIRLHEGKKLDYAYLDQCSGASACSGGKLAIRLSIVSGDGTIVHNGEQSWTAFVGCCPNADFAHEFLFGKHFSLTAADIEKYYLRVQMVLQKDSSMYVRNRLQRNRNRIIQLSKTDISLSTFQPFHRGDGKTGSNNISTTSRLFRTGDHQRDSISTSSSPPPDNGEKHGLYDEWYSLRRVARATEDRYELITSENRKRKVSDWFAGDLHLSCRAVSFITNMASVNKVVLTRRIVHNFKQVILRNKYNNAINEHQTENDGSPKDIVLPRTKRKTVRKTWRISKKISLVSPGTTGVLLPFLAGRVNSSHNSNNHNNTTKVCPGIGKQLQPLFDTELVGETTSSSNHQQQQCQPRSTFAKKIAKSAVLQHEQKELGKKIRKAERAINGLALKANMKMSELISKVKAAKEEQEQKKASSGNYGEEEESDIPMLQGQVACVLYLRRAAAVLGVAEAAAAEARNAFHPVLRVEAEAPRVPEELGPLMSAVNFGLPRTSKKVNQMLKDVNAKLKHYKESTMAFQIAYEAIKQIASHFEEVVEVLEKAISTIHR